MRVPVLPPSRIILNFEDPELLNTWKTQRSTAAAAATTRKTRMSVQWFFGPGEEIREAKKRRAGRGVGILLGFGPLAGAALLTMHRRGLEEFGSSIKKETAAIGKAATRAVRDLPGSLESGASVTQASLESVGQAIDDFSVWRGTAEIISQSNEALLTKESDE